jgi:hypothetical protein
MTMRLLHVSDFVSHHQLPLARCFVSLLGKDNFRFAATHAPNVERKNLGWAVYDNDQWILKPAEIESQREEYQRWWSDADVVLCGGLIIDRMQDRLSRKKLTFSMSERWWKPPIGMARLLHPKFARMTWRFCQMKKSPFFHYLAIGHYAARDIRRISNFKKRLWLWAYFTSLPDPLPTPGKSEHGLSVLWAGRMLGWKRVDTLIKAFPALMRDRPDATLTLVGTGPERRRLEQLAQRLIGNDRHRFLSSMPVREITALMRRSHVYVLPSNAYEGWGAVVNEAMGEGCSVIASEESGSARTIIRNGENGLLFPSGNWRMLGDLLRRIGRDEKLRYTLAVEGQRSIAEVWSPHVGADRFCKVVDALLSGCRTPEFATGPLANNLGIGRR